MTGTEMIDAIAHIDEDLIDGCVARMKARSSETVALHAKEEIREKTKKPLPAFAKAALAFGALAAVLLLSFALISLLHIGGKSPTPIGPVSTQTPAPTEAGNEDGESPFRYSVVVVLDNEESLKFKTYGAEDFPEADATEVVNVSEALEKSIRELVENGVNNEDVKEYNKCLRIVLKDPCEENASACASRLRERDHVVSAEPYLEPYDVTIEGLRCSIAETILNAAGKITVADRVFLYPRSFHIDVTNEEDGRVYDLSYAYKNGMMTYDGLSELYRIHVEYMIRKFGYTEETYKKEAFVHYAFIGSCEIGFAHEETGEIEVKDVAGSKFIFAHPFTIVVQKIGEEDILDITEAYEADLLTEEDVAEAARLHREFVISTFDFGEKLYEELAAELTEAPTPVDTFAEEILSVPVKWYSYDELSASPELGEEMTYLESIEDMEMVHYSPEAFCVTDDGEIAIVDTIGARLCVYDLASGQLKRSAKVGEILETPPIRAAKYDGVYYVLIPYYDPRIVTLNPDGTTSEIPVPQLKGMLEYSHVSEFYAEDGRLILTLIGPSSIETKAVSLSDGSVSSLYSTQWTLENDTFTITRNGMRWSFPAEPSSGVRSTRIDVLKVGENGELYVIQEVPIEGQDDMGLYQIYDKEGRLIRCEKIDYFMDSYMTADGGRIVGPDDYLYEMHCDEDAVRIIRIVPAEPTEGAEPMTLGNGHTANFTFVDKLIFVDFELPEGFELRTEKGDETKLPLLVSPHNGGYIFGPDGKFVGCFTAYPYDESATDDDLERIYAEFRLGHWHIMLEEMYEPIADHGTVHPALTLAEGVELIDGQTIGENARFICDALIAYDTASHAKLELAFFRGKLDRKQLTAIAQSIILSAEDRNNPAEAGLCGSDSETSFDFSACSEKILSLTPYIAVIQPELPEDAPEDVILYIDNSVGGDVTNLSARWIASDGHYLCIYDMRCCLTVFKDGAFLYRKFAYMGMGAARAGACLTEGRLYSADAVVDVMTGEVIAQLKMREPCEDSIVAVKNKDGRPVLITERMDGDQICFDRYELGDDNAWALAGEYLRVSGKSGSDENENAVIECGGESYTIEGMEPFPEGRMMIELLGIDSSGAVVLNVGFGWIVRCEKGYSVAKTMTHPFDPFALWDPDLFFDLLPDGTIYMGVPLTEAFEIYRISFRSAEPTEVFLTKMIDAEG